MVFARFKVVRHTPGEDCEGRGVPVAVDNKAIAEGVLAAVGGKENITSAVHCMTRLRLNVANKDEVNDEAVKKVKGVIGAQWSGGQYQVIIGQNVDKVYGEFTQMAGVAAEKAIDENLDAPKEKLTPAGVGNAILNYLSRTMVQLIPVMIAAGLFKTVAVLVAPDMLNLVPADSDLVTLMNWLYEAGFYFLPIYLGYAAAKTLGVTSVLGMFMGGILISPTIIGIAAAGEVSTFSVYGLPAAVHNYSQTVLPIILSIAAMKVVEDFFKKHIPATLSTVFTPFLTMIVMVPVSLVVLAPLGGYLGDFIGNGIFALGGLGGVGSVIAMAIIGGLWQLLVVTGMHTVIITLALVTLMQNGQDTFVFVSTNAALWAVYGVAIGSFLRFRNKEEKALAGGYVVSAMLGGVTEPTLFGLILRFKRTIPAMAIGGAIGAVYCGITHVAIYPGAGVANVLCMLAYIPGGTMNLVNAFIGYIFALVVAAVLTYLFAYSKADLDAMDAE